MSQVTTNEYKFLSDAFKFFNKKLFKGELPDCLITLQRKPRTRGYFSHERMNERDGSGKFSEIALNPDSFEGRTDMEVLSTLVHEQVHMWEYFVTDGKPSRRGYHNKMWSKKMVEIGLMPSSTGEPGGKTTGQKMTHYIIDGGKFEVHCGAFLADGKKLTMESTQVSKIAKERKKTRWKFTCPKCQQNAWGKKHAKLMCGKCEEHMVNEDDL